MSTTPARRHAANAHASGTLAIVLLAACLPAAAASPPQAGEPAAPDAPASADPVVVVSRTVHPRIAYRALEPTDNPVRVQAPVFPARVFHSSLDRVLGAVAGDGDLGARGNVGLAGQVRAATSLVSTHIAGPAASAPTGSVTGGLQATGAGAGGVSLVGMTSGIAATVLRAVGATSGGGP